MRRSLVAAAAGAAAPPRRGATRPSAGARLHERAVRALSARRHVVPALRPARPRHQGGLPARARRRRLAGRHGAGRRERRPTRRRAATSAACTGTARTSRRPPRPATNWVLRFESVNYRATVWLNGRRLGRHTGGYLPFELEARGVRSGTQPPGRARGQPPQRGGHPAARRARRRQVRGRLVELRGHPARGLPAQGRHLRLGERLRAPAPGLPDLRRADLRARGRGEHGARARPRRGDRHGRRQADQLHPHDDRARAASTCSAAARGIASPTALEPRGPAPLHGRAGGRRSTAQVVQRYTQRTGIRSIERDETRPHAAERHAI